MQALGSRPLAMGPSLRPSPAPLLGTGPTAFCFTMQARLCQQDRDAAEAFIASLDPANEPDASQDYDEVEQHTWFAEFHDEQQQQQQPAGACGSGGAGPSTGRAGDVFGPRHAGGMRHEGMRHGPPQSAPRFRDPLFGDVEWQSAQNELQVARLLQDNPDPDPNPNRTLTLTVP